MLSKENLDPSQEAARLKTAIIACFAVVVLAVSMAISIGGSYLLSESAINKAQTAQHSLQVREEQSQIRASEPTCKAVLKMNAARLVGKPDDAYEKALASSISNLYGTSRCAIILSGKPITVIMKELSNGK